MLTFWHHSNSKSRRKQQLSRWVMPHAIITGTDVLWEPKRWNTDHGQSKKQQFGYTHEIWVNKFPMCHFDFKIPSVQVLQLAKKEKKKKGTFTLLAWTLCSFKYIAWTNSDKLRSCTSCEERKRKQWNFVRYMFKTQGFLRQLGIALSWVMLRVLRLCQVGYSQKESLNVHNLCVVDDRKQ